MLVATPPANAHRNTITDAPTFIKPQLKCYLALSFGFLRKVFDVA